MFSLAGQWQVRLDSGEAWRPSSHDQPNDEPFHHVRLPGALRESGVGEIIGPQTQWIGQTLDGYSNSPEYRPYSGSVNFKQPFFLQPERRYVGSAWYQRTISIPEHWSDRAVALWLERPHGRTRVFFDDQEIGSNDSLSTPHEYDLGTSVAPGQYTLSICVDNSLSKVDVGYNAHSVTDHTQSAWHGIVGRMELRSRPLVAVQQCKIVAVPDASKLRMTLVLINNTATIQTRSLRVAILHEKSLHGVWESTLDVASGTSERSFEIPLTRPLPLWDEFSPELCQAVVTLGGRSGEESTHQSTFGCRKIGVRDKQILVNDRPVFLRGTLECCVFPLTGYPPTDVTAWERIVNNCRSHGLNHIRFHSWCPPEAAFIAADRLGFYLQVECGTWPFRDVGLGRDARLDDWLYQEATRILDHYGNHPSLIILAAGNEPTDDTQSREYLTDWVNHFNSIDDRMLITGGAGWPKILANQIHIVPEPRQHQWGQGLSSRINCCAPDTMADHRQVVARETAPVISHEIGQWCAYPNFKEIRKYTGTLFPKNYEIFSRFLADVGMSSQAEEFVDASGRWQSAVYKEEIEACLRTPNLAGFQMLGLTDFPGQGTAPVGILDVFWDPKPYTDTAAFRRFCGPIVPLVRMSKRTWSSGETFVGEVDVSHFGTDCLQDVELAWTVSRESELLLQGVVPSSDLSPGGLRSIGRIEFEIPSQSDAAKWELTVELPNRDPRNGAPKLRNSWEFWVYPNAPPTALPKGALISQQFDDRVRSQLKEGKAVLLVPPAESVDTDATIGMSPIFWNAIWTYRQPPNTLGILCDPSHAAFSRFPTESHTNWQWWELIHRSAAMDLGRLQVPMRPLIQVIPEWSRPSRLGLAFEANVHGGKLLVCTVDILNDLHERIVARQLRESLLTYIDSPEFSPAYEVSEESILMLFRQPSFLKSIGASIESNDQQPGNEATLAIDGDLDTIWHSRYSPVVQDFPHWIEVDLKQFMTIRGVTCYQRRDSPNGQISDYRVETSRDGKHWATVASGTRPFRRSRYDIYFEPQAGVRYVRLVSLSDVTGQQYSSLAELDLIVAADAASQDAD